MRPQIFQYSGKFNLELGGHLPSLTVAYHTYGRLNKACTNVIWVCHALTANSDVAEWWPGMVGEGSLFDPDRHFIVCANILGSCYGSTGPMSTDPETGLPWFGSFPRLTIRDLVKAHELLREHLGIQKIHTITGGSIGGFQALEYSIMYPHLVENLVFIASSVKISPWATAFNESQRLAIRSDPTFGEERHYGGLNGLKAARSMALLSYRNSQMYNVSQQEEGDSCTGQLRASSYQVHQGEKLAQRFDAFSYYQLTEIMDTHNIVRNRGSLGEATGRISARVLCIGISSDILFPTGEQKLLAHLTRGEYREIDSDYGHDGFLLESGKLSQLIRTFWDSEDVTEPADPGSHGGLKLEWTRSA